MKSVGKKGGKKIGRNCAKRCQKAYVLLRRTETNAARRAKRHAKRVKFFALRRAARKRCARHAWKIEQGKGPRCGRLE